MKKIVNRYRFEPNLGERELTLPEDAEVIGAGWFNGAPAIWVKVADTPAGTGARLASRRFLLTTVGMSVEDEGLRYLGLAIGQGYEILIFEAGGAGR